MKFIGAGALVEHGPFKPGDDNVLVKNYYSWNKGEPTTQQLCKSNALFLRGQTIKYALF